MNTTELTDDEIRVRIAKACGWTTCFSQRYGNQCTQLLKPDGSILSWNDGVCTLFDWLEIDYTDGQHIPDYLNDLNAMHVAEKTLTKEQRKAWILALAKVLYEEHPGDELNLVSATARQRALAFLAILPEPESSSEEH